MVEGKLLPIELQLPKSFSSFVFCSPVVHTLQYSFFLPTALFKILAYTATGTAVVERTVFLWMDPSASAAVTVFWALPVPRATHPQQQRT